MLGLALRDLIRGPYHAKYFAYALTRRCPSDSIYEPARTEGQKGGRVKSELRNPKTELGMSGPFDTRNSSFAVSPDPACGSGPATAGLVYSARFAPKHKRNPDAKLSLHDVEKTDKTGRL